MTEYMNFKGTEKIKFWEKHFHGWRTGNLSKNEYCLQNGISKSTFEHWQRKLKKVDLSGKIVEVSTRIQPESHIALIIHQRLTLHLGRDFDPELLLKILSTLGVRL
jgi:hypothetical protein